MQQQRQGERPARTPGTLLSIPFFGVPVRFHFTFILLVVFLFAVGMQGPTGLEAAIYVIALFACVLLHEMGHVLTSRRYGIKTLEIVMYPIGGVARLEKSPKPSDELWIALAGPAVNVVIAAVLIGTRAWLSGSVEWGKIMSREGGDLIGQIAAGNLMLAIFNLIPAFPMDGGRVLRSLLALKYGEARATDLAARAGRGLAILMGLYGLLSGQFLLMFVAFFVYLGATQENAMVLGRTLTQGVPVRAAMVTDFRVLNHGQTIRDAAELLLATSQQDFPVMLGEQVLGLLGRTALLRAMAQEGPDAYVSGVMDRSYVALEPSMDLAQAMTLLANAGSCALVMEGERLLGLLTAENLTEFLILRQLGLQKEVPA